MTVHKWLGGLNDNWKAAKYYQVGFDAATYGHNVLGLSALKNVELPQITDNQIIQTTLNGLFEENKLLDPTTIVPCIDDDTAHKIVVFVGQVLDKAAKGSISDLIALKDLIQQFGDQIPDSVKKCLDGNAEFEALGVKYGVTNTTDPNVIEKKVIEYVTLHYLTVHKWLGSLNDNWKAAKYYQVGFDVGSYGHQVLGMSEQKIESAVEGIVPVTFGQDNVLQIASSARLSNLKGLRFDWLNDRSKYLSLIISLFGWF